MCEEVEPMSKVTLGHDALSLAPTDHEHVYGLDGESVGCSHDVDPLLVDVVDTTNVPRGRTLCCGKPRGSHVNLLASNKNTKILVSNKDVHTRAVDHNKLAIHSGLHDSR